MLASRGLVLLPASFVGMSGFGGTSSSSTTHSRDSLVAYLRDEVDLYDLLLSDDWGVSSDLPYDVQRLPGAVFRNRIPPRFVPFVQAEAQTLADGGCGVPWSEVRAPGGPRRPWLAMALTVKPSKPRLIVDARPLNERCEQVHFSIDTVARVVNVASPGCFLTSLDDSSAFHHILLRPSAWPLFGFEYGGVDVCWCVLPFGSSLSPWVYYSLSDAKAAFLRSHGIPARPFLGDSW